MALVIYSIYATLTFFLAPIMVLFLVYKKRRDPSYGRGVWNLLGLYGGKDKAEIIFHCVSVGEAIAARPLIQKYIATHTSEQVLVTTTTTTGRDEILKIKGIRHAFMPLDSCLALRLFMRHFKPRKLFIMETELWPNLLRHAHKCGCKICIFNARMPEKTCLKYYKHQSIAYKLIFKYLDLVLAQTKEDKERFERLGLEANKVYVTNSLKYDLSPNEDLFALAHKLKANIKTQILAILSTHDGEEEMLLESYLTLRRDFPDLKLVLVPRHQSSTQRAIRFLQERKISYNLKSQLHTDLSDFTSHILIGDTFGEMEYYLGLSDVVIMGGSFIDIGGHNPLEPAYFSLPIITGPYYYNFRELFDTLIDQKGAFLAQDHQRLYVVAAKLLRSPNISTYGMNAMDVQQRGTGAIKSSLQYMANL